MEQLLAEQLFFVYLTFKFDYLMLKDYVNYIISLYSINLKPYPRAVFHNGIVTAIITVNLKIWKCINVKYSYLLGTRFVLGVRNLKKNEFKTALLPLWISESSSRWQTCKQKQNLAL